jgi:CubicO group peptidase (beta-lactamase class C family)
MGFVRSMTLVLAAVVLFGCVRQAPRAIPALRPAAAPAASTRLFSPGTADLARRAKVEALVPALDEFFQSALERSGATGLAVGLILEGELVYERGLGVRDVTTGTPVDSDTVFRIASMTKSFTALAVLKLRDEGKLTLDAPVTDYLPELRQLVAPTRDAPPITLRLLLTNASGLAYDDYWGAVTFGTTDAELAKLLRDGVQFESTPGTAYAYSNLGWALLGKVVERVSGMRYRDYVAANILRPLDMTSTVWESGEVAPGRLAVGYGRIDGALVPEPRPSEGVFAAAGGLYTTLRDYARYAAYNLAAYPPRDEPESGPVRRSTLREMHEGQRRAELLYMPVVQHTDSGITLTSANYGFGWMNVTSCTEEGRVQHFGMEPGYYGWVALMPKARIAVVALATTGAANALISRDVGRILRDGGLLAVPEPTAHPALAATRAAIVQLLDAWDPALATRTFDPQSLAYSWNVGLREDFVRLARSHGHCQTEGPFKVHEPLHGGFRLSCERGALTFEILMSPATPPRIQNVNWTEELPAEGRTHEAAIGLAAAIGASSEALPAELFAPSVDLARARKTLTRLGLDHGACSVDRGHREIPRNSRDGAPEPHYTLRCSDAPLELTFTLDEETGQVTTFSARPPRAPDATCWESR